MEMKKGLGEEAFEKLAALREDSAKVAQEGGYQGYKNYETYTVALILENDRGSYEYYRERAQEIKADIAEYEEAGTWDEPQKIKFILADEMKDSFESQLEELSVPEPFQSLLNGALSEVRWEEVVEQLIQE